MSFVLGFVAGVAVVVGGWWGYNKHLEKVGHGLDLEDWMVRDDDGAWIFVPERFEVVEDGEDDRKEYVNMDKIRLVLEDNELVGWYQHE